MAALLLAVEIPGVVETLRRPDPGFQLRQNTVMVVDETGPARDLPLQPGDRVLSFGGRSISSYADFLAALHGRSAGETVSLEVERGQEAARHELRLAPKEMADRIYGLLLSAVAIAFLFLGFVTYYRRDDELGHAFYLTCLLLAYPFLDLPTSSNPTIMRVLEGFRDALLGFMPAVLLRFLLIFPEGAETTRRRYRRHRLLLIPPAVLAPLHFWSHFAGDDPLSHRLVTGLLAATALLFAVYVVGGIVVFARKIRRRDRWVLWTKLRLALLGLVVGLVPLIVVTLLRQFTPTEDFLIDRGVVLLLPLVPASFSMAMLRTGAIDLADIQRQLAMASIAFAPSVILAVVVPWVAPQRLAATGDSLLFAVLLIGIPGLSLVSRIPQRLGTRLVDTLLDPDLEETRRRAAAIAQRLNAGKSQLEIAEDFAAGLIRLLSARRVSVYGHEEGQLHLLADRSIVEDLPAAFDSFSDEIPLVRRSIEQRELLLVDELLQTNTHALDEVSRGWLDRSDAAILFPLESSGAVVGLGTMSGPAGRSRYSSAQLFHLQSLSTLAGAALENARLHDEELAHERVRTELALAHEIQQRLLPQEGIDDPRFEVCGRTRSCREVGGDLFDHFRLSDGRLVCAVADASGKGVPASLLISGVRTAIRETVRPGLPLEEALAHINRQVHETTSVGHFIAAMVAILEPDSGQLEYCVAGIEPPLWVRIRHGRLERLTRGGPILGVDPDARFRSGVVRMAPGDQLLVYSDGLVDQENSSGDPFGAKRLEGVALSDPSRSAQELLEVTFGAVREFRTEESVDDTTLLVLRRAQASVAGTNSA